MTRDALFDVARAWVDAVNSGDRAALQELLHADFVQHTVGLPPGPTTALWFVQMFRQGFPDLHIEIDWLLADGDRVVVRATSRGTHRGVFLGHPPTNRSFVATSLDVMRIADRRVAERWTEFDTFGMLQQLGIVPAPGRRSE